jgi:hypothetical protein
MGKRSSFAILSSASLIFLILSAVFTTPALADGGTTNPSDPAGSAATRTAPAAKTGDAPNLPGGTKVVVVDSTGDKVPLGSQAAQQILSSGDPIWCPATLATPTPGAGGCTSSQPDLATLFGSFTSGSPSVNGTIWIEQGSDSSTPTLDGSGLAMANFTLTLKGGWDGSTSSTPGTTTFSNPFSITSWNNTITISNITVSGATGTGLTVTSSKSITLTNVQSNNNSVHGANLNTTYNGGTGSLTITNSQFNSNGNQGASIALGPGGTAVITSSQFNSNTDTGLEIASSGAITLTNVTANSSTSNNGALLDNTGASAAPVTISGTSNNFNSNYNNGLDIQSNGAVVVNDVSANGNTHGIGLWVNNSSSAGRAAISLTGAGTFDQNAQDGLYLESGGMLSANDLTVSGNGTSGPHDGAFLQNYFNGSTAGVTLTGVNVFDGNSGYGMEVDTYGAIKAGSLIADANGGTGIDLENGYYNLSTPVSKQPVTLTGSSQFNNNGGDGLDIGSNGLITANNLTALFDQNGAMLTNETVGITTGITLTGTNVFNNNKSYGLSVRSNGAIKLNSVTADGNDTSHVTLLYGLYVDNTTYGTAASTVTLTGVNSFNGNYDTGFTISSTGAVTLNSVTANQDLAEWGGYITSNGAVTLSGLNTFNEDKVNGLSIFARGSITVSNLTASGDGQDGVQLDTCDDLGSGCTYSGTPGVTVNGVNTFNSNVNSGLVIDSKGAVKANSVTANCNGYSGACGVSGANGTGVLINNCHLNATPACTGGGSVTFTGTNFFNSNYGGAHAGGLDITTGGAVSLSSTTASLNQHGTGIRIDSTVAGPTVRQPITLSGTFNFNGNWDSGALLLAFGKITASNVTANWNSASGGNPGLGLNNWYGDDTARPLASVSLTGVNTFIGNGGDGMDINATGAISVSSAVVSGNGKEGLFLGNANGSFVGVANVTFSGITSTNNGYEGVDVDTHGTLTASNLAISGNDTLHSLGVAGLRIQSSDGGATTITGTNNISNNYDDNVSIAVLGSVSLNNLTASGSATGVGANIQNGSSSLAATVKLTGTNVFSNDHNDGLRIAANGKVTLNSVTADGSAVGYGLNLSNLGPMGPQNVALTGVNQFNGNDLGGLRISSYGAISAANVTASGNTNNWGAYFSNDYPSTVGGVTLSGTNVFNNNTGAGAAGLSIYSKGTISLNNVTADGNAGQGAFLQNDDNGTSGITLTGLNWFSGNGTSGLETHSAGNLSLSQATFTSDPGTGLFVHNDVSSSFSVSIKCGNFSGDGFGISLSLTGSPITGVNLTGVTFAGNSNPDLNLGATPVTQVRDCPLP